jgi:hypothetical protein
MRTFWQWLARFKVLGETYITFDPAQYNALFDEELRKVISRTSDAKHRQALEGMRTFNWLGYIATSVRRAGFHDQREVQERTHDLAVKLLTSKLFTGFDERVSGPFDLRFKRSLSNAIKNLVELEKNRRRLLPTIPIRQKFEPGGITADDLPAPPPGRDDSEKVIHDFRNLVRKRLGGLGVAVLQVRLDGGETKSLIGGWLGHSAAVPQLRSKAGHFFPARPT